MKTFRAVPFILLSVGVLLYSCKKDDDDPDNGGDKITEALAGGNFDVWEQITVGAVSFDNPAGDWWASLNMLSVIGGPATVGKTADAYAGPYAARLETKKWGDDLTIPGILASGYFDKNLPMGENLVIGKPFDRRPVSLNGFYKYSPAGADSLVILIALTKYLTGENRRDTIAQAELVSGESLSQYAPFSIDLNYASHETPDSIHVILLSSIKGKEMQGYEGSVLFVDELSLTYD